MDNVRPSFCCAVSGLLCRQSLENGVRQQPAVVLLASRAEHGSHAFADSLRTGPPAVLGIMHKLQQDQKAVPHAAVAAAVSSHRPVLQGIAAVVTTQNDRPGVFKELGFLCLSFLSKCIVPLPARPRTHSPTATPMLNAIEDKMDWNNRFRSLRKIICLIYDGRSWQRAECAMQMNEDAIVQVTNQIHGCKFRSWEDSDRDSSSRTNPTCTLWQVSCPVQGTVLPCSFHWMP